MQKRRSISDVRRPIRHRLFGEDDQSGARRKVSKRKTRGRGCEVARSLAGTVGHLTPMGGSNRNGGPSWLSNIYVVPRSRRHRLPPTDTRMDGECFEPVANSLSGHISRVRFTDSIRQGDDDVKQRLLTDTRSRVARIFAREANSVRLASAPP